ncbi:MAG: hypothetical protein WCQ16_05660 [Verrucomicrobiae bacterium]
MNQKHISCGIIALLILALIQATLWVQNQRTQVQKEAGAAQTAEETASSLLARERVQLSDLRRQSTDLIEFLRIWQPYFTTITSPQSAEINMQMRVKDANLVNLSQRFDQNPVKGNTSIPTALRSLLTFEDDYSKLLNWLGTLEKSMPTVRTSSVHLTKGTRANDLRMEVILEQPMLKQ